jgi:hypothetical protein
MCFSETDVLQNILVTDCLPKLHNKWVWKWHWRSPQLIQRVGVEACMMYYNLRHAGVWYWSVAVVWCTITAFDIYICVHFVTFHVTVSLWKEQTLLYSNVITLSQYRLFEISGKGHISPIPEYHAMDMWWHGGEVPCITSVLDGDEVISITLQSIYHQIRSPWL